MSVEKLTRYAQTANIADELDDEIKEEIITQVIRRFEDDKESMKGWLDNAKQIMDLVKLEEDTEREGPLGENSANVRYPLITTAVINNAARALPEAIRENKAVRALILGRDPGGLKGRKAQRVTEYMNYKLLEESNIWLDQRDRLLSLLGCVGTVFTKCYYDPVTNKIVSKLMPYDTIIVNNNIDTLDDAPAITEVMELSKGYLKAGMIKGYFTEVDLDQFTVEDDAKQWNPEFLQQHLYYDLDEDGIPEPYLALVHPDTRTLLRLRANYVPQNIIEWNGKVVEVRPEEFFTDYHLIPNPTGFYSFGFGTILRHINETVNTLYNQLLDAGQLANATGGFVGTGIRLQKGRIEYKIGEFKQLQSAAGVKLKDEIVPFNFKEPSMVLFQLLDYLTKAAKELSSTTEALTGTAESQNVSPTTLFTLVQEGDRPLSAIRQRVFRGLKKEFKKLYRLYSQFIDNEEYIKVIDPNEQEMQEIFAFEQGQLRNLDFDVEALDIIPVSDPAATSTSERLLRGRSALEMAAAFPGIVDVRIILRQIFSDLGFDDPDNLFTKPEQQQPPIEMLRLQQEALDSESKDVIEQEKLRLQAEKLKLDKLRIEAEAVKDFADAQSKAEELELQKFKTLSESLLKEKDIDVKASTKGNNVSRSR